MEYSLDSNPLLLVPSSVENSQSNGLGVPTDDPLGISSKTLDHTTLDSAGESHSESFSCFQLSGQGEDSQTDSSQSLHVDEANDVIPQSPGVMHIDLAATPSVRLESGIPTASSTSESCGNADEDSGRISPDMIASCETPSADLAFEALESHSSNDEEIPSSKKDTGPSNSERKSDDASTISESDNENIFDAETQAYSESSFLIPNPQDVGQGRECSSFVLQKLGCDEVTPTPVILTASTQTDSEIQKNHGDASRPAFSDNGPAEDSSKVNEEFTAERSVDEAMDIDSQEIIVKDVSMRSGSEGSSSNSPKAVVATAEKDSQSAGMESQAYSQEELHLHLTFESQLFDGSSLATAETQPLVINEQSQSLAPSVDSDNCVDPIPERNSDLGEPEAPPRPNNSASESTHTVLEQPYHDFDKSVICKDSETLHGVPEERSDNNREQFNSATVYSDSKISHDAVEESCEKHSDEAATHNAFETAGEDHEESGNTGNKSHSDEPSAPNDSETTGDDHEESGNNKSHSDEPPVHNDSETTGEDHEESCSNKSHSDEPPTNNDSDISSSIPEVSLIEENKADESESYKVTEWNTPNEDEAEKFSSTSSCGMTDIVDPIEKVGGQVKDGLVEVFETMNVQKVLPENSESSANSTNNISNVTKESNSTDVSPSLCLTQDDVKKTEKEFEPKESQNPSVLVLDGKSDDTGEPISSMQSTYVDETLNHMETDSQATSSEQIVAGSQSVACSYDASAEDSSMDQKEEEMELASYALADLETQPFTLTLKDEFGEKKEDPEKKATECEEEREKNTETLETPACGEQIDDIQPVVQDIIDSIVVHASLHSTLPTETPVTINEHKGVKGQSSGLTQKALTLDKELLVKVYDFRSQSQPSQGIDLKSPFRTPTSPPMREASAGRGGSKKGGSVNSYSHTEKDGSNSVAKEIKSGKNEEHDKSSDTLPPDDNSSDSDPLVLSEKLQPQYRLTKTILVETLWNGEVVDTETIHRRPKIVNKNPYASKRPSQSSSGSGYLADTSSLSRTSSDTSTQTDLSLGGRLRMTPDPVLRTELSGSSSSSGSSVAFVIPNDPSKTTKSTKSPDSRLRKGTNSPRKTSSSPTRSTTVGVSTLLSSPLLKESHVVLTPLSTELIASKISVDIDTPPLCIINPPLSGSTPLETPEKDPSTSDITTSHSPEIGYPSSSVQGTPLQLDDSCHSPLRKSPQKTKTRSDHVKHQGMIFFGEEIPVMARLPTGPYFYPGRMQAQDPKSGKYLVNFDDDGKERPIREADVLLIDTLDVGQEVQVLSDCDMYSPGVILTSCRDERGYVVKTSSSASQMKTKNYPKKHVIVAMDCLTKEQKMLRVQPLSSAASADVSLDNIVEGNRRTRRSNISNRATSSPASSTAGASSSSVSKTPKSSRKRRASDSQSSASSSGVPFPSKSKRAKLAYGSSRRTPSKKRRKSEHKTAVVEYKETKIFENCGFLLTSTTGMDHPSSEFDSPPCDAHGYDRDLTRRKIVAGGGQVVKDFTQLMSCDRKNVYLLSNSDCRTMNYFNALAAGVPCLSYVWIDDSTNLGEALSTSKYTLPAGYSLLQQGIIERSKVPVHPLSGLRVSLQMKDPSVWSPLLCLAGCKMVSTRQDALKDDCPLSCDVVVADKSCSEVLMERARSLQIPTVSIEWVIQCLIGGKKLPYDAHTEFKSLT